jgi:hypothetical protein
MNLSNIMEVTNLHDLKNLIETNLTVVLGLTTKHTSNSLKVIIRRFLKRKAEKFPLIVFIYMEVSDANRQTLNILQGDIDDYPMVYHIRAANKILCTVKSADETKIYESFANVEQNYIDEMKYLQQNKNHDNNDDINSDNQEGDEDNNEDINQDDKVDKDNEKHLQIDTFDPVLEKKKTLEKMVFLNKKYGEMHLNFLHTIAKRKKIEKEGETKKLSANKKENEHSGYKKKSRKN